MSGHKPFFILELKGGRAGEYSQKMAAHYIEGLLEDTEELRGELSSLDLATDVQEIDNINLAKENDELKADLKEALDWAKEHERLIRYVAESDYPIPRIFREEKDS